MLTPDKPVIAKNNAFLFGIHSALLCNKTMNSITSLHFFVKPFLDFRHLAVFLRFHFMDFIQAVVSAFTFIHHRWMYTISLSVTRNLSFREGYQFIVCWQKCRLPGIGDGTTKPRPRSKKPSNGWLTARRRMRDSNLLSSVH